MNSLPSKSSSRSASALCSGLCIVGVCALATTGWILFSRSQSSQKIESASGEGFALLERSMRSDQTQSFSAAVESVSFVGDKKVVSESKIVRAPRHTSIQWVSGPMQGAQSGFSNRWLWRQSTDGKVLPYAEVADNNSETQLRRFKLLQQNYDATMGERIEFAGRPVQQLELKPKAEKVKGPARRFFIDLETGVVLKTQGFDSALNPVFETSFKNVDFTPEIGEATFGKPAVVLAAAKKSNWQGEELGSDSKPIAQKIGFLPPKSTYLPSGFELDGYGLHRCKTPDGMTQCASFARYSDGLNSLTVFAMKPCDDKEKTSEAASVVCDFGAGMLTSRQVKQGRLIAVADLPLEELQKVLASSNWQEK